MFELLELLLAPFAACLIIAALHCYMGIHIVQRGVIFVDLALAQMAVLGTTVGIMAGYEGPDTGAYLFSLGFIVLGALLFTLSRLKDARVPQEAIIGIVYVVSTAAAILLLDRTPHGMEEMKAMLVGSVLFVSWSMVGKTFLLYLLIAVFHIIFRRRFWLITYDINKAREEGLSVRLWDFLYYISFGIMIVQSVRIAGVLLVFTYLVVPAVCAMILLTSFRMRLVFGWLIGLVGSFLGLIASASWDLPTGAAVVTTFGAILVATFLVRLKDLVKG